MPPSESEVVAARLARMKTLIDSLEQACSENAEQQELFLKLRAEMKAARDALKIARFRDFRVVDREHEIAALETQALRRRTIGDFDNHHPLSGRIDPKIVRQRRRQIGNLGALEWRRGGNDQFIVRGVGRSFEREDFELDLELS